MKIDENLHWILSFYRTSEISGAFSPVLDGRFLRHRYHGTILQKERHGEELIAYNAIAKFDRARETLTAITGTKKGSF